MTETIKGIEFPVLLESVRARVSVARLAAFGTFLSTALFLPFLDYQGVSYQRIALWVVPIVILTLIRTAYSMRVNAVIDQLSQAQLDVADGRLRASSVVNQFTVGTGIWIMQSATADAFILPLFMTLVTIIYAIGAVSNLFSDYRSLVRSIPLLLGQPALFWLMQPGIGISIGLGMLLAMSLTIATARRGSQIFRDSVLMRFEKDALLQQVEQEKERTQLALADAQAANNAKAYFMAAASHDIKQPLFALGMLTDTLIMSDVPDFAQDILAKQRRSIDTMSNHFDALMDLGKFQGGSFTVSTSASPLSELQWRINDEFQPQCAQKGLQWSIDFDDVQINSDQELLMRLFRNLLSNAVRYTAEGRIDCSGHLVGERVEFAISDTGPGIAEADQEQVFKQFVRLDNSEAEKTGAGLGLSIVEHIGTALELDLQLHSAVGEGTRFTFSVPALVDQT